MRQQLAGRERLAQEVIGTRAQITDFCVHVALLCQDDDQGIMHALHLLAERHHIDILQRSIEQDKVWLMLRPLRARVLTGVGTVHLMTIGLEQARQHLHQIPITVHYQKFH